MSEIRLVACYIKSMSMLVDLLFPKVCNGCGYLGNYLCLSCRSKLSYVDQDMCLYCESKSLC